MHPLYHHSSTVLLLSTLLLPSHRILASRVYNPCITYLSLSHLFTAFIKLIIFASEIENGMTDDPPATRYGCVSFQLLRGIHEADEGFIQAERVMVFRPTFTVHVILQRLPSFDHPP